MNGTPSYVIGKQVVIGAVGVDNLKEKIASPVAARQRAEEDWLRPTCRKSRST